MRNRYPGECYRCKSWVPAGDGHFERIAGHWRVQHATCAIQFRGVADEARQRETARQAQWAEARRIEAAKGTGKRAQRARQRLRQQEANP